MVSIDRPVLADVSPPAVQPHPPTHDDIALRAYFLWNASPFHDSDPIEDWLTAERQLWDEYTNGADAPSVRPQQMMEDGTAVVVGTSTTG